LASSAPPTSFVTTSGFSSSDLAAKPEPRVLPSWGQVLSRALRASSSARASFHRPDPSDEETNRSGTCGSASREVLAPSNTTTSGAPLRHALPCGRTRGTRIARPSSVPSSGFLPLSTVPASTRLARSLLDLAVRRGPRRFAALFHAARVPGAPLQSFPFPGSRTRSRGPPASLWVRSPTAASVMSAGALRPLSPIAPALCRASPPEGRPGTHEP